MSKNNYFKGWYFKCCANDTTIAFIPAYHHSNHKRTTSLQIITDNSVFNIPFIKEYILNYLGSGYLIFFIAIIVFYIYFFRNKQ